ncbi:hypothetical protein GO988_15380 [Hymenobacter sp. HMF4947]|uniref:Uncharacterized protein n=1 Tax=Hymenobacter ginkgonis TaxID=2682976 RepID=A0A7K1TH59_9BACT|nr:hypothetical protein [Hymenobacter ginkgonis]MVN77714.1 hypothetical protein [Hymenobacter ginkgonis]
MSLFSIFRSSHSSDEVPSSPESVAPEQTEEVPAWVMSKEEYDDLRSMLKKTLKNLDVVDHNVRLVISRLETLQDDMGVSIRNELIIGRDQDELIKDVRQIKHTVNSLSK